MTDLLGHEDGGDVHNAQEQQQYRDDCLAAHSDSIEDRLEFLQPVAPLEAVAQVDEPQNADERNSLQVQPDCHVGRKVHHQVRHHAYHDEHNDEVPDVLEHPLPAVEEHPQAQLSHIHQHKEALNHQPVPCVVFNGGQVGLQADDDRVCEHEEGHGEVEAEAVHKGASLVPVFGVHVRGPVSPDDGGILVHALLLHRLLWVAKDAPPCVHLQLLEEGSSRCPVCVRYIFRRQHTAPSPAHPSQVAFDRSSQGAESRSFVAGCLGQRVPLTA
mmetsp:Transcript_94768/g.219968  ORF Transcript_94768/g.219968 Transcript_94768/m.219968 type:complete len:271 (+) Transcript_94768:940-1752(+)